MKYEKTERGQKVILINQIADKLTILAIKNVESDRTENEKLIYAGAMQDVLDILGNLHDPGSDLRPAISKDQ